MSGPKITHNVLRVCSIFIRQAPRKLSCYALAKELAIDHSTVWATLGKLESSGWLKSEMERVNPAMVARPRRRLYRMTDNGTFEATKLLSDLQLG